MRARLAMGIVLLGSVALACAPENDTTSGAGARYSPPSHVYSPPSGIEPTPPTTYVPDVVGENLKKAKTEIRDKGLRVRVKYKTSKKKPGTVLAQNPEPFEEAEEGDSVTLTVAEEAPKSPSTGDSGGGPTYQADCTPGYSPCLPPASDYDCAGGSGNGPEYVSGPVYVDHSYGDPYGLDADGDGVGCES